MNEISQVPYKGRLHVHGVSDCARLLVAKPFRREDVPLAAMGKTIKVRGEGLAPCSAWVQEHDRRSSRQHVRDSWLLGYVNAASAMLEIPGVEDVSEPFHNIDLVMWIDDYCSAHPGVPLIRAADELMRDLARRAQ